MPWAILDTNVYIDHWEGRLTADALASVRKSFVVRHSAVVLSELRRGARTFAARRRVEDLHRVAAAAWEPTEAEWWEAGRIILKIGDTQGWEAGKRRDFQNDTLIALTARRHGATVVTRDRRDFDLLSDELRVRTLAI